MRLKRASYREAIEWIAANDNAGNDDDMGTIAGYISVLLIADIFGTSAERVAHYVWYKCNELFVISRHRAHVYHND